jgi:hypothetical protein
MLYVQPLCYIPRSRYYQPAAVLACYCNYVHILLLLSHDILFLGLTRSRPLLARAPCRILRGDLLSLGEARRAAGAFTHGLLRPHEDASVVVSCECGKAVPAIQISMFIKYEYCMRERYQSIHETGMRRAYARVLCASACCLWGTLRLSISDRGNP